MFNLDYISKEKITEHNLKMDRDSQSSTSNINDWRLWIWKKKCIVKFNK